MQRLTLVSCRVGDGSSEALSALALLRTFEEVLELVLTRWIGAQDQLEAEPKQAC